MPEMVLVDGVGNIFRGVPVGMGLVKQKGNAPAFHDFVRLEWRENSRAVRHSAGGRRRPHDHIPSGDGAHGFLRVVLDAWATQETGQQPAPLQSGGGSHRRYGNIYAIALLMERGQFGGHLD